MEKNCWGGQGWQTAVVPQEEEKQICDILNLVAVLDNI